MVPQDLAIIALYIILVMTTGLFAARNRSEKIADYFLAGRQLKWFAIGASLFVTSFSFLWVSGLIGTGSPHSFLWVKNNGLIILVFVILGWLLAPAYLKIDALTIAEFFEKRYNETIRIYLAAFLLIFNIFIRLTITLWIGIQLLNHWLGLNFHAAAVIIVILTGLYTIIGGMRAVAYTAIVQMFFLVSLFGVILFSGIEGFSSPAPESLKLVNLPVNGHLSGIQIVLSFPVIFLWFGGVDQFQTQRIFSARNNEQARGSTLFAGLLILVTGLSLVLAGANSTETAATSGLPDGVRGLFFTGTLAVLMASLANIFVSSATLFTIDFYRKFRLTSERKQLLIGRLFTTYLVIVAVVGVPLICVFRQYFWQILLKIPLFFIPHVSAVFLIGLVSKRATSKGAIGALNTGFLLGLIRLILELIQPGFLGTSLIFEPITFSFVLFLFTGIVHFGISFMARGRLTALENVSTLSESLNFKGSISRLRKNRWYCLQVIVTGLLVIGGSVFLMLLLA